MNMTDLEVFQKKIKEVLITEDAIKEAIAKAAAKIDQVYAGKPLLIVSILKGAYIFHADLSRAVTIPHEIGFMAAQSYFDSTESCGEVELTLDLAQDISNYHVIIAEDIVDTGRTLSLVVELLKERKPLSLQVVTLLDKPDRRVVDFKPDEVLFRIPDEFVIGYGLDCGEYYRNLPYIAVYDNAE